MLFGPIVLRSCANAFDAGNRTGPSATSTTGEQASGSPDSAAFCPPRIAEELPESGKTTLVAAYRTKDKQITLCRTAAGNLYYYGEFTGRPNTGIAMPAIQTTDGFTARNGAYKYEISGDTVVITVDGRQLGREDLTRIESPS
ncbi:hypothetical protein ACGF12_06620 [Kitasatospora sp. NPDC048296]|uniref:hypothetical protein n=1 Tax=Kitasatospora sp. NPDC048296 TaxID=3364048 RepID=UPI00371AE72A